jgi:hypothetical protein
MKGHGGQADEVIYITQVDYLLSPIGVVPSVEVGLLSYDMESGK